MSARTTLTASFPDNALLQELVGPHNANLTRIAQRLGIALHSHGNTIAIEGARDAAVQAEKTLRDLYQRLEAGQMIDGGDVDGAARMAAAPASTEDLSIRTKKRHVNPRTPGQRAYFQALAKYDLVFALGPAGTGKTYLAVAKAVAMKLAGEVDRIILSRPAVEAGERLGFLPGDMKEKVDPYLRPLYDALYDCMPPEQVERRMASGEIEVAPIAFMRGRTLADAFVILDEAQNTTPAQMKMFLTRFGQNSRMVVCGDPRQVDIPGGDAMSGLADAVRRLEGVEGIAVVRFGVADVVRHPIVGRIVEAYEGKDA